jgi:predicted RNA binding protein YcfA (HicA-like mRNA interferase family)
MARLAPISRVDLVRNLLDLGFVGPFKGGAHQYMERNGVDVRIPNPHGSEIDVDLLNRILKQAGVTREEWLKL